MRVEEKPSPRKHGEPDRGRLFGPTDNGGRLFKKKAAEFERTQAQEGRRAVGRRP